MKKLRTTIRLPKAVRQEVLTRLVDEGYGLRGKSRWIGEAIKQLLVLPGYHQYVDIADEMNGHSEIETIMLAPELKQQLNAALLEVRRQYPQLEGVQSRIIRSSIMQRLLRS
jgi:hypothetical protein